MHLQQKGVTLIELVMIIILIGVIAIPFSNAFLTISRSLILNADITQGGSLARECAEFILHQRRTGTITASPAESICDDPVIPGFNAPQETVTVSSDATGTGNCPAGSGGCDLITITVNDATVTSVRNELYLYLIY